jgi:hypothetical protein
MLHCSDVMPNAIYAETVDGMGLERSRRQMYASVARALLNQLRENSVA